MPPFPGCSHGLRLGSVPWLQWIYCTVWWRQQKDFAFPLGWRLEIYNPQHPKSRSEVPHLQHIHSNGPSHPLTKSCSLCHYQTAPRPEFLPHTQPNPHSKWKKKKRLFRLLFHQRVWETLSDRIIISNTWQVVTEKSISKMNERRVRISNIWQDNEFHQMTRHRKHYLSKWDSVFYNFEYWLASVNFSLNINTRENNHLRDSMRWLLKTPTVFYVFFLNSQSHCAVVEKSYM